MVNTATIRVNRRAVEIRAALGLPLIYHFRPLCVCPIAHVWSDHGQKGVPA